MSNWTHVAGIVRLDNMLLAMVSPEKLRSTNVMRELSGHEPLDPAQEANDSILKHFKEDVPTGSEGSLKIAFHAWPVSLDIDEATGTAHVFKGGVYWGDIVISGDLRDFDEPMDIANWLVERCESLPRGIVIREGAFHAYAESGEEVSMFTNGYDSKWKLAL